VEDAQPDRAEPDQAALGQFHGRHRWRDLERGEERLRIGQPMPIERVDRDLGAGLAGDHGVVPDVIPMPVGRDDQLECPATRLEFIADPGQARRGRVDRDRLARAMVGEDVDVRRYWPDDPREAFHRPWLRGSLRSQHVKDARIDPSRGCGPGLEVFDVQPLIERSLPFCVPVRGEWAWLADERA